MNKRKIMSSVVKSSGGVTYTPSLVTLESGEDIKSVSLMDTDILSGQSIQQILNSGAADTLWQGGGGTNSINRVVEGDTSTVTGDRAVNMGINNTVSGEGAIAAGSDNNTSAKNSIVSGRTNIITDTASYSVTTGAENKNNAQASIVSGANNTSSGNMSVVTGRYNKNDGAFSVVSGTHNVNNGKYSIISGSYNVNDGLRNIMSSPGLSYSINDVTYNEAGYYECTFPSNLSRYVSLYSSLNGEDLSAIKLVIVLKSNSAAYIVSPTIENNCNSFKVIESIDGDEFPTTGTMSISLYTNYLNQCGSVLLYGIGTHTSSTANTSTYLNTILDGFSTGTRSLLLNGVSAGDGQITSGYLAYASSTAKNSICVGSGDVLAPGSMSLSSDIIMNFHCKLESAEDCTYTIDSDNTGDLWLGLYDMTKYLLPGTRLFSSQSVDQYISANVVSCEKFQKEDGVYAIRFKLDRAIHDPSKNPGDILFLGAVNTLGPSNISMSMIVGSVNSMNASQSLIVGYTNQVLADCSSAIGMRLYTTNPNEFAIGYANQSTKGTGADGTRFSIGFGINNNKTDMDEYHRIVLRRNAMEVKQNADMYIYGVGGYDGKRYTEAQTLQEVLAQNANDITQIKEQIGQSTSDNLWYRTEVTETDEDYTKWTNGDSYSIVNSKTNQPYNTDITGCRNIVGGYRNKISGDDSLAIGHDNISEGNQNLVLGCNSVANSSSSIVLNDAGWSLKARYTDSTSLSKLTYTIEELDSDMLLASVLLANNSVSIKLRNIPVIGNIDGGLIEFDKQDTESVTAVYGTDPNKTVTIDFSICQTNQSCSISMGGIADNSQVGYYSLAMNGGITNGMGAIATGYGARSRDFSLALGASSYATNGSIALSWSNATNSSISIPSYTIYSYTCTFDNQNRKLLLSNSSDENFDKLSYISDKYLNCFVSVNKYCIGKGSISKNEDGTYYIRYNNLEFVKYPSNNTTSTVSIGPIGSANESSINIGGNSVRDNSLGVGLMNLQGGGARNCAMFGNNNIVYNESEVAIGSWNYSLTGSTKFTVGVGTSDTDRKNAFEVTSDGSVYINGVGDYVGNNASSTNSVKAVIDGKQDTLVSGTSIKTINGESILGSGDITISGGGTSTGKDVYIFETNSYIGSPLPSYQFTYEDMVNISTSMNSGNYSQMYIKFIDGNLCAVTYYDDFSITATSGTITMCIQTEYKPVVIKIVNISGQPRTTYSIQTTNVFSGGSDIITISPNVFYNFGPKDSLTVSLGDAPDTTSYNEYMFQFESGDTPTSLTVGAGFGEIKWIGDHTVEANKTYQVSIVNNLAVMGGA